MRRSQQILLLAVVAAAACKPVDVVLEPGVDGGPPTLAGLLALRVDPTESPLLVDRGPGEPASHTFVAWGTFEEGERDVSKLVEWRLGRPEMGQVVSGLLTTQGIGGATFVEARSGSIVATAAVKVRLELVVDQTGQQGAQLPVEIDNDRTDGPAPQLIYPADGVTLPVNIASLEPQWTHDASTMVHELRIESQFALLRLITADRSLLLGNGNEFDWVLRSHVGQTFTLFVRSVDSNGGDVFRSNAVTVAVSRTPIEGTGYFWSSAPPSVLRAQISSQRAEQSYPTSSSPTGCTGCHAVSRDGRKLASSTGRDKLAIIDLQGGQVSSNLRPNKYEGGAFNPGATRFIYADEGRLIILDVAQDTEVSRVPLPAGGFGTHPNWSPDGTFIVFSYTTHEKPEGYKFEETSIARVDVDGAGGFSALTILAAPDQEDSLGYPAISLDGRFVAYTRVRDDDGRGPDASIEVVLASGGVAPVALTSLNRRVGLDDVRDVRNIIPNWVSTANPQEWWLSFSSRRAYGHRLGAQQRGQIWMSAFDPERAEQALDPSGPAFWLPFQPLTSSNYRYMLSNAAFDSCASTLEVCNNLDDDCDEEIDESCCQSAGAEVCGNLLDDDCNGLADDGCDCSGAEQCSNGLDDDCDRAIDGADSDCP